MTARQTKPRRFTHHHRQRLDRAIAHYLKECFAAKTAVRVSEFAAVLNRNPQYLGRVGTSIVGVSLRAYIRKLQIQEAERLLKTTPLKMHDIAISSGFGTPATFYRSFRAAHGMSPSDFRQSFVAALHENDEVTK